MRQSLNIYSFLVRIILSKFLISLAGGFIWWIVYMGDIPDVPDWFVVMCLFLFIGYVIIGVPIQLFFLSKKAKKKIQKNKKRYKENISQENNSKDL